MRQLIIQVPQGNGKTVIDITKSHNGTNLARLEGNAEEPIDVVIVHVSNREVGKVLEELQDLPNEEIGSSLTQSIQAQLLKQDLNVTPLVDVNVLEPPASKQ
ncbi:hypothetical protein [Calothrix sp. 336/3]|uniref:hypothetical protein n=1 Tax=Calothrix sp. 336/3 TaxID=1337936 RepID=UPI0004E3A1ED|nr:hypothetical protein [Calothrix sp. 336/3]AKG20091.1 hypothetical protein IJ00_01105 [Calothrix sp. 336/3]